MVLARFYFGAEQPDATTMGQALWLHQELMENIHAAVAKGVNRAFSKK